jgi:hypothetical protein
MKTFKTFTFIATCFMLVAYNNVAAQCSTPTGLSATIAEATSMNLMWAAVAGADDYTINIQNGPDNPVPYNVTINDIAGVTYLATGLSATTNYKFKVRTNCGGDHSSWSEYFFFYTGFEGGGGSCDAITGLATTEITATTASFTWDVLDAAIKYRIRVEDGSGNPVEFGVTMVAPGNSASITGLTPSSNYKFKVRGRCPSGSGSWSDWFDFSTIAGRIGDINSGLSVYPNPANSAVTIQIAASDLNTNLQVIDLTGKVVFETAMIAGATTAEINVTDFAAGIYQVVSVTGNTVATSKLVVTK